MEVGRMVGMRSGTRAWAATGALALAVVAAACGGDSTSSTATPTNATAVAGTQWTQVNGGLTVSTVATIQPAIKVTDKSGNPVPNVHVTVQILGGGTVQRPSPTTNSSGIASVGAWTLGPTIGTQSITMTVAGVASVVFSVPTTGSFAIDVRYVGTLPSSAVQAAFTSAALRMSRVITTKLSSVSAANIDPSDYCDNPGLPKQLDPLVGSLAIYVEVVPIDGVGQVLGQSGPCGLRASNALPFLGMMQFDSADLAAMVSDGTIGDVILHEMQHVLGFGTLWGGPPDFPTVLVQGAGTANPVYLGPSARTQYVAAGGSAPTGVPVEGGNVTGTSNAHWRKSTFQSELMTGYISGIVHPYSKVSIAALEDLGYAVTFTTADEYFVPAPGALRSGPPVDGASDLRVGLIKPRYTVDERTGQAHRIR